MNQMTTMNWASTNKFPKIIISGDKGHFAAEETSVQRLFQNPWCFFSTSCVWTMIENPEFFRYIMGWWGSRAGEDRMQSNRHVRTFNQSSELSLKNPFYVRFVLIKIKYFYQHISCWFTLIKIFKFFKKFKVILV